jgi:hypothetical protein
MLTRLKKAWRMVRGQEEYALTVEESKVLTHVLQILSNRTGYRRANIMLWETIVATPNNTVSEQRLSDVMKTLSQKLLKQADYD